jgi:hypothetical protein
VRDGITGRSVTRPATSEEAQQAVGEWNARCVTRQVDPPVKVDGWGLPVNCGCGCGLRMAGGALSLAGMGRGGYAPRIYARPELIPDEVFAPSFHQGRGVIGESNLATRSLGPLGTHRSVAVAGVDLGWCERVAGLLFMPVPQEKAGKQTPS